METKKSVKTSIVKLIQQLGGIEIVANRLGLSKRQVYYLAHGRKVHFTMADYIKGLVKK